MDYYSTSAAADELQITRQAVLRLIDRGTLPGQRNTREEWQIPADAVHQLRDSAEYQSRSRAVRTPAGTVSVDVESGGEIRSMRATAEGIDAGRVIGPARVVAQEGGDKRDGGRREIFSVDGSGTYELDPLRDHPQFQFDQVSESPALQMLELIEERARVPELVA